MIGDRFRPNMTDEMLACMIDEDALRAEIEFCAGKYREAEWAGDISLPATAASGKPVVHGALTMMDSLQDYWAERLSLAKRLLPRTNENDAFLDALGISTIVYGHTCMNRMRRAGKEK